MCVCSEFIVIKSVTVKLGWRFVECVVRITLWYLCESHVLWCVYTFYGAGRVCLENLAWWHETLATFGTRLSAAIKVTEFQYCLRLRVSIFISTINVCQQLKVIFFSVQKPIICVLFSNWVLKMFVDLSIYFLFEHFHAIHVAWHTYL